MLTSYEFITKNGIKKFKRSTSSIEVTLFPVHLLNEFLKEDSSEKPAVYILYNKSYLSKSSMYIGETENIARRLKEHKRTFNKTFWTDTIVLQSTVLNKALLKNIESKLFSRGVFADRAIVVNSEFPTKSVLSDFDQAKADAIIDEFLENLVNMNINLFEHYQLSDSTEDNDIYYLYHSGGTGKLRVQSEGKMLLLKDSVIVESSVNFSYIEDYLKKNLIEKVEETVLYVVRKDIPMQSENEAAVIVTGDENADFTLWRNYLGEGL